MIHIFELFQKHSVLTIAMFCFFLLQTTDIAKIVSEAWREMPPDEREVWEAKARKDKQRYEVEKALYKGPWKVPANKRTPKDPTAPKRYVSIVCGSRSLFVVLNILLSLFAKRPMSAFLAFSNKRRAALKRENPDATNADLSRMLSVTWKEAPDNVRKQYMEEEAELRAKYKVEMAKWKKKAAEEKRIEREEREAVAMQAAEARNAEQAAGQQAPQIQIPMIAQSQVPVAQDMTTAGVVAHPSIFNPYAAAMATGQQAAAAPTGFNAAAAATLQAPQQQTQLATADQQQGQVQTTDQAQQYANMMAGNQFAQQQFAAQQQLLTQIFGKIFSVINYICAHDLNRATTEIPHGLKYSWNVPRHSCSRDGELVSGSSWECSSRLAGAACSTTSTTTGPAAATTSPATADPTTAVTTTTAADPTTAAATTAADPTTAAATTNTTVATTADANAAAVSANATASSTNGPDTTSSYFAAATATIDTAATPNTAHPPN